VCFTRLHDESQRLRDLLMAYQGEREQEKEKREEAEHYRDAARLAARSLLMVIDRYCSRPASLIDRAVLVAMRQQMAGWEECEGETNDAGSGESR
jgi:hypothetical protein